MEDILNKINNELCLNGVNTIEMLVNKNIQIDIVINLLLNNSPLFSELYNNKSEGLNYIYNYINSILCVTN